MSINFMNINYSYLCGVKHTQKHFRKVFIHFDHVDYIVEMLTFRKHEIQSHCCFQEQECILVFPSLKFYTIVDKRFPTKPVLCFSLLQIFYGHLYFESARYYVSQMHLNGFYEL